MMNHNTAKLTIQVKIGNIAPILNVVNDLIAFGIPNNVPQGVQDVIIAAAGGNITFKDAVNCIAAAPTPTPNPTPPPSAQPATRIVSFSGFATNIKAASSTPFSSIQSLKNNSGTFAQWVGLNSTSLPITFSYPSVPDCLNLGSTDTQIKLKFAMEVRNNNNAGLTIQVGSSINNNISTSETGVITTEFPFAASESSGVNITIDLKSSNPNKQIILAVQAEPGPAGCTIGSIP